MKLKANAGRAKRPADVMMLGLRSIGIGQGGVETHVANLARELDALGYDVDVVVRKPYATGDDPDLGRSIRLIVLPCVRSQSIEALMHTFLGVLYAGFSRPAVLHIHAVGPALMAPLARLLGLRVVCTHHGEDYRREKWGPVARWMLKKGEQCQASFAHERICVSKALSVRLSHEYGVSFRYIPNEIASSMAPAGDGFLAGLGLSRGKYILNVSRLVPEKRHLDLIEAYKRLGRSDIKLVLVGDADHTSEYARTVKQAAAETPGVVTTGFRTGACLASLFDGAAVFALPSSHEGLSIALLEAMSYGSEVVLSDIEANLDVRLPKPCYHKLHDVADLATCLAEAFERREREGRVNWDSKLSEYSWTRIAEETTDSYDAAIRQLVSDYIL